ncbi:unnamed protein product [Menidia menidia]|uniref:(Atlantic silverside) hypothetical protein n=1 Tax=Menidia menidia TaxID=238744 RepID=A0A8S4AEA8_9TELE|nr:unnamed protein product [Menidia menidia]
MDLIRAKIRKIVPKKPHRSDLLIENNNNDIDDDGHIDESSMHQNSFNIVKEQLLGPCIHSDLSQNFPKHPDDLDKNLRQHLSILESAVLDYLKIFKYSPSRETDSYHQKIFAHLHVLLQDINLFKNAIILINWVLKTYLSKEELGKPDPQLLDEWKIKAEHKVCQSVQECLSESLLKILEADRNQKCNNEETYIGLCIDIVQYIDAILTEVKKINSGLLIQVQDICFQELHVFVKKYTVEQKELLNTRVQNGKESGTELETMVFLKTMKTCKEIKKYIAIKGAGIQIPILEETVTILENMETFTLKLLTKTMADDVERQLKGYFTRRSQFLKLGHLNTQFPKLLFVVEEQKMVMDEAYKTISYAYLKHLIQFSHRKLRRWDPSFPYRVVSDADQLHRTFSDLAPGVHSWHSILRSIPEILECKCIDGLKLTMAKILSKRMSQREDLELFPALIKWKGHSKREVQEVMEALPGSTTSSGSSFFCFVCCR